MAYAALMIDREQIARTVQAHRARLGLSQVELAKKAKIGSATLKRIEGGQGASLTVLKKLATFFDVDIGDLIEAPTGRASVQDLIDRWVEGERLRPRLLPPVTEEEVAWLRSLPRVFWIELPPTEETLENLVRARRSAQLIR